MVERRTDQRFTAKGVVLAEPAASPLQVASIIDISMSGLAFRCSDAEEWPADSIDLEVLLADDDDFYVNHLPCRIVSNTEIDGEISLGTGRLRRCGVRFTGMTPGQKARLSTYLRRIADRPKDLAGSERSAGKDYFSLERRGPPAADSPRNGLKEKDHG